jgi:hypothetical protein
MEALFQDVRYALRTLRKSPLFLIIVVLTLALGIGANVAIFTLVNAVLLRPLPFPDPDRLVRVFDDLSGAGAKDVGMSVPELEDLRHNPELFEQVSAIWPVSTALSGGDRVERIEMLGTSPNYVEILGAHAALGTVYKESDGVPGFSTVWSLATVSGSGNLVRIPTSLAGGFASMKTATPSLGSCLRTFVIRAKLSKGTSKSGQPPVSSLLPLRHHRFVASGCFRERWRASNLA